MTARWYFLPEGVDPRAPIVDDEDGGAVALEDDGVTEVIRLDGKYFTGPPTFS